MASENMEAVGGAAYEAEHVHAVYSQIANHFSSTRYKPWPITSSFLQSLPPSSIGLDIGCGNGKYLPYTRPDTFVIASDACAPLVSIATTHQPHDALVADTLSLPHPLGKFDFAICIAVLHHLSTRERRVRGVGAVLAILREGGKALVYVWALEQRGSRRGWGEGDGQDVMVPWVLKEPNPDRKERGKGRGERRRKKGREGGRQDGRDEGQGSHESQVERQLAQENRNDQEDASEPAQPPGPAPEPDRVFNRYYHLYRAGELEEDVASAGGVVLESGYEKDNWWAIVAPKPVESQREKQEGETSVT